MLREDESLKIFFFSVTSPKTLTPLFSLPLASPVLPTITLGSLQAFPRVVQMALSQFTHSVPPSCCSPFIPSSPFPPLAFEFTFYAPLSTSAASFFYSQEPVQRTKNGIVSIDEEVWGEREGKDDETDRFICDAMKSGEGLDKDQKDIMIKGRAGREAEGSEGESGKKRIRDGSESLSSRGVGEGGRVEKRIRVKEPQEENDRGGGVATDVVRSIRRNSRASPSYELNPSLKVDEPILPFRRLIDTSIQTIHRFVNPFEVESYLTSDPVPVSHSHRYFSTILQFMAYVENPSIWETSRGLSVFRTVSVSRLTRSIRDQSPNFRFIREQCPLGSLYQAPTDAGDSVYGNTSVSFNVLEWLWGAGLSNIEELRWVVEKSPLPLFALCASHHELSP